MSSLCPKDRVSLCSFTFSDGRRCRTPRISSHPHFCFDHAQKEARAWAAQTLGKDLDYFFSGDYLSACDLSTALGRLIPAVIRGDLKPKTAHTVAYLAQTLMQAIHVSRHEYCEAFGSDAWREAICNSVTLNHNYLFPPAPALAPVPPAPSALRTNLRTESPQPQPASPPPQPQPGQPAPSVLRTNLRSETPQPPPQPAQPQSSPPQPQQPVELPVNCHSERSEESASSSNSSLATRHFPNSCRTGPCPTSHSCNPIHPVGSASPSTQQTPADQPIHAASCPSHSTRAPSSVLQELGSSATRSSALPSRPGIDGKLFRINTYKATS